MPDPPVPDPPVTAPPQFVDVDGRRLEFAWAGAADAEGPVLVFLHKALGCVGMWREVPAVLARMTGRRAIAYSRAGYGRSDPVALPRPLDFHDIEAYDVLPRLLDALGIETAVLIGHSDGATIALLTAARDRRIRGVVSMAAHVFNERITRAGAQLALGAWKTTDLRAKLERYHGAQVDDAFFGWNDVWLDPAFHDWNIEDRLIDIHCPVLIVQGTRDQYGTAAQVEAIAAGVSGPAQIMMIDGCGHAPHQDAPALLFPRIVDFVAGLTG